MFLIKENVDEFFIVKEIESVVNSAISNINCRCVQFAFQDNLSVKCSIKGKYDTLSEVNLYKFNVSDFGGGFNDYEKASSKFIDIARKCEKLKTSKNKIEFNTIFKNDLNTLKKI